VRSHRPIFCDAYCDPLLMKLYAKNDFYIFIPSDLDL